MRKLETDSLLYSDDTVSFVCECGSETTIVANEEDRCQACDARYYAKVVMEVWKLDEDDDAEELEDEEEEVRK